MQQGAVDRAATLYGPCDGWWFDACSKEFKCIEVDYLSKPEETGTSI